MDLNLEIQKKLSSEWFLYLQSLICYEFERIEKEVSKGKRMVSKKFKKNTWSKKIVNEGGGQYFILKNGQVFDQVGVNFSKVQGKFPKNFRSKIKLNYKYDESLIGGLVVQVGSTMVDSSIKNKLQQIENRMIEA